MNNLILTIRPLEIQYNFLIELKSTIKYQINKISYYVCVVYRIYV